MKKVFAVIVSLLITLGLMLSGCDSIYKNMKMKITNGNEITIFLDDNKNQDSNSPDDETQNPNDGEEVTSPDESLEETPQVDVTTQTEFVNTALITVKISGVKKKVSKEVLLSSSDVSKLRIESIETDGGTNTVVLRGIQTGIVKVKVQSAEGGLTDYITVNIVKKTSAITIDPNYKFAVMANGNPYKIDETKILQEPHNANTSSFLYSLKQPVAGINVTEDGYITVSEKTVESFVLQVRPKYAENQDVVAELEIPVYNEIVQSDLSLYLSSLGQTNVIDGEIIEIIKNKFDENQKEISFNIAEGSLNPNVDREMPNLKIDASILDQTIATFDNAKATQHKLTLIGLNIGATDLRIKIYFKEFQNIVILDKTFNLVVSDVATTIALGSNVATNEMDVYNIASTSSLIGSEFVINVYPDTASNRKFKLELDNAYQNIIRITNSSNRQYDLATTEFYSGQKLYISHNGTIINTKVQIKVTSCDERSTASKIIDLNLLLNIQSIECDSNLVLINNSEKIALDYTINPVGALKSMVTIVSSNTNIVTVSYSEEDNEHYILPVEIGTAKISFYASNRLLKTVTVEVVTNFQNLFASIDSPSQNSNVSNRNQTPVRLNNTIIGYNTSSAIIKVGKRIKINTTNYPEQSKVARIEYSIVEALDSKDNPINADFVDIENGYVRSSNTISLFYVLVRAYGYVYDDATQSVVISEEPIEVQIAFTVIMPITDVTINAESIEVYDINTVGYAEAQYAQSKLYLDIYPKNATVDTNKVNWTVSRQGYENILDVQEDGSVIITGRLSSNAGNQETLTIRATIAEYDLIISRECTVTIKKAKQV